MLKSKLEVRALHRNSFQIDEWAPSTERIARDLDRLAGLTESGRKGYTRLSFSPEDRAAREYISEIMAKEAGLTVRTDTAGNLIGRRPGLADGPCIMSGSHLDTVREGGRFDGVAGVLAALESARLFHEADTALQHPLEVVVFLAEEPSPFGLSCIGSRAMTGSFLEEWLDGLKDESGRTLRKGIAEMNGCPDRLSEARRKPGEVAAFFELHIEQGPVLFEQSLSIGVVTGIVGIHRGRIVVEGRPDHAGTTPMDRRRDALAASGEVVLAVERMARRRDGMVGTIGTAMVYPNAANVVPGRVEMVVETRSLRDGDLMDAGVEMKTAFEEIGARREVRVDFEYGRSSTPVTFEDKAVSLVRGVCDKLEVPYREMPSGAGHDAGHLAHICPTGMIFIPSQDGRSHCPEEWTGIDEITMGTRVLANVLTQADREYQLWENRLPWL